MPISGSGLRRSTSASKSSRRSCTGRTGRSANPNSALAARSGPVSSVCHISCMASEWWFESACRSASDGMMAASYPRISNEGRNATRRERIRLRLTMSDFEHNWKSDRSGTEVQAFSGRMGCPSTLSLTGCRIKAGAVETAANRAACFRPPKRSMRSIKPLVPALVQASRRGFPEFRRSGRGTFADALGCRSVN